MNRKPTTAEGHAGIFHSYSDIPARYRLDTYTSHYENEETLTWYLNNIYYPRYAPVSDHMERVVERVSKSWMDHMANQGRHPALATPEDVDQWCKSRLESCSAKTCYTTYFQRIYNFYEYLKADYRHPHLYNPLLVAAIEYDTANRIWRFRVKLRPD